MSVQIEEADRLMALGEQAEAAGDWHKACEHYRAAVEAAPGHAKAQLSLGVALEGAGDACGAIDAYEALLAADPANPYAGYNFGKLLYTRGELERAEELLECALRHKPGFAEALVVLSSIYHAQSKLDAAATALETALQQRPDWPGALHNYALVLKELGQLDEAQAAYSRLVSKEPENAAAGYELATLFHERGALGEAKRMLEQVLQHRPQFLEAYIELGLVYQSLGDLLNAERSFRNATALNPNHAGSYYCLGDVLTLQDERRKALEAFEKTMFLRPDYIEARWAHMVAQIPAIYDDPAEIASSRAAFIQEIDEMRRLAEAHNTAPLRNLVGISQPFYLAYSRENNRDLLKRYGELCVYIMRGLQESLPLPEYLHTDRNRIRVGIISAQVFDHSVWNAIIKGWVQNLDITRFQLGIFYLGTHADAETDVARSESEYFESGNKSLQEWIGCIVSRRPDVLIYAEIGMDPTSLKLACLRLAPVQVATWGHPETTGLPTIDYYLSAECLEPAEAEQHYTESLVKLPGIGVCYQPVPVVHRDPDLAALGIDHNSPLLLNPGVPFKYSPLYDWMFVEIAKRTKSGQLIFFVGRHKSQSERLRRRLAAVFASSGLDFDRRVKFIPWLDRQSFYGLMKRADVFLDTIGFSGFNTAIRAVECGLPIVTLEGRFMRGRLASGILDRMGFSELVAKTDEAYIELAVRLAGDPDYRDDVRSRITQARSVLYNDVESVRALEAFLENAVTKSGTQFRVRGNGCEASDRC